MTTNLNPTTTATGSDAVSYDYVYFISYTHNAGGGINFVNAEVTLPVQIRLFEEINLLQDYYRKQGYANALILSYTLMRTVPAPARGQS
ncbi:hypothetical protein ACTI_78290 [Actinoplanes sp. OR16]|uniref:hypothetical protein n=1 Tax=Actinoplanes sp. OR16 TaxID=946334 RepID=UPI000F6D1F00|nr:hypothetical protein [Actinoplanes sp. OR16]BBH71144.1 hypothetical protein ACTI_78290 [Actinoplanes sp. OR16]